MKLGFFTACLAGVSLDELARWASEQGFEALELAAWPAVAAEGYSPHHVDAGGFDEREADRVQAVIDEHGLEISALGFYENLMDEDQSRRESFHTHLKRVIDSASILGVDSVGTFVGARPDLSPAETMSVIGTAFRDLTRYAADHGVRLMIENCPMLNWQQFSLPGNLAYSPELWDRLFDEVDSPNLGLNLDPSHLLWLGIDYVRVVHDYPDRIFHAHAKDTEIVPDGRYRYGILARQLGDNPWDSGWWRYRMPGRGEIDWTAFMKALEEVGYAGALSIEHEDPDYEGSEAKVKEGLKLGLHHLQQSRSATA